jgi:serine/threonine-protein kinase
VSAPIAQLQNALTGRYQIERELGHGGMATVFLARDLKHDRSVALKVLHAEVAATLGSERFEREIKTAARLQHPHILSVHDSGAIPASEVGPALLWFTMPFVEGETLRDRLTRERQLPVEDAVRIAREIAEALHYAHRHDVVHRDIKPENILLTADHALVADFGIARALGGGGEHRLTETGLAVGTPAYMSPEQASGEREVDARSDLYSLGCVLYEMLTGEVPFSGATPQAIMAKRFTGDVPAIRRVRPSVPEGLEQTVQRALASVPADRFATAGDLARALAPGMTTSPGVTPVSVPGPIPTLGRTAAPFARRPLFTVLLLGVALGGGLLFAWSRRSSGGESGARRIAVLPFDNLGPADQEYFADGITDEVRGKLTALHGLEVLARGSSSQYRRSTKTPRQIGQELGVQYLLTGTVRWEPGPDGRGRVKVSPELIQVSTGSAKWQEPFDAPLTDVFQVQADIAGRVANALNLALGEGAREQLAEQPTSSEEAYNYYLRGRSYEERARLNVEPQSMNIAEDMYRKAIGLDSSFALAWARLSGVELYLAGRDATTAAERGKRARQAVDRALALRPTLAEGHVARGNILSEIDHDRASAMKEYSAALVREPNNAELLVAVAWNQAWRGQADSAVASIQRAVTLDPRSAEGMLDYGDLLYWRRRYAAADTIFDRAIALAPDQYHAYFDKANNLIDWKGDVEGARRVMREAETRIGPVEFVKKMCVACFDWTGPLAANYERILDQLDLSGFSARDSINYFIARAQRATARGDHGAARTNWESARGVAEHQRKARPDSRRILDDLADIYAGLGRREDVVRVHARFAEVLRASGDTTQLHNDLAAHWAVLHLVLNEPDAAIDSLRSALADTLQWWVTVPRLRVDPFWGRLKGNPRFEALLR